MYVLAYAVMLGASAVFASSFGYQVRLGGKCTAGHGRDTPYPSQHPLSPTPHTPCGRPT